MKPHKHAEFIKAWADGATIQCKQMPYGNWLTVNPPSWESDCEYRVKPEDKKVVVRWLWAFYHGDQWVQSPYFMTEECKKRSKSLVISSRKLEYSRTEFEE